MSEERNVVDVVEIQDMTTVQVARALVILQIERIADLREVRASNLRIDLVRPRVIHFEAQAVPALLAQSNLQTVVAGGGLVGLFANVVVTLVGSGQGRFR